MASKSVRRSDQRHLGAEQRPDTDRKHSAPAPAAAQSHHTDAPTAAIVNTVVSLFYYLRVLAPLYFGELAAPVATLGQWIGVGSAAVGLLVLALGLGAEAILALLRGVTVLP